jgi:hypothetical protein
MEVLQEKTDDGQDVSEAREAEDAAIDGAIVPSK